MYCFQFVAHFCEMELHPKVQLEGEKQNVIKTSKEKVNKQNIQKVKKKKLLKENHEIMEQKNNQTTFSALCRKRKEMCYNLKTGIIELTTRSFNFSRRRRGLAV